MGGRPVDRQSGARDMVKREEEAGPVRHLRVGADSDRMKAGVNHIGAKGALGVRV